MSTPIILIPEKTRFLPRRGASKIGLVGWAQNQAFVWDIRKDILRCWCLGVGASGGKLKRGPRFWGPPDNQSSCGCGCGRASVSTILSRIMARFSGLSSSRLMWKQPRTGCTNLNSVLVSLSKLLSLISCR